MIAEWWKDGVDSGIMSNNNYIVFMGAEQQNSVWDYLVAEAGLDFD